MTSSLRDINLLRQCLSILERHESKHGVRVVSAAVSPRSSRNGGFNIDALSIYPRLAYSSVHRLTRSGWSETVEEKGRPTINLSVTDLRQQFGSMYLGGEHTPRSLLSGIGSRGTEILPGGYLRKYVESAETLGASASSLASFGAAILKDAADAYLASPPPPTAMSTRDRGIDQLEIAGEKLLYLSAALKGGRLPASPVEAAEVGKLPGILDDLKWFYARACSGAHNHLGTFALPAKDAYGAAGRLHDRGVLLQLHRSWLENFSSLPPHDPKQSEAEEARAKITLTGDFITLVKSENWREPSLVQRTSRQWNANEDALYLEARGRSHDQAEDESFML